MKTPLGYLLLFYFGAFLFSCVGLAIYVRLNDRRIAFKETTTWLRKRAKNKLNIYQLILWIWWLAWFFLITGFIVFILFFVVEIIDLEEL